MEWQDAEFRLFELRAAGERAIEGTVIRYGDRAEIAGVFTEEFRAGSIELARQGVTLNLQHDRGRLIARTGVGLTLHDDPDRLTMRAELPRTTLAADVLEGVRAGLYGGLSAEFRALDDAWTGEHRTVRRAILRAIAVVDVPAYGDSAVAEARAMVERASAGSADALKSPSTSDRRFTQRPPVMADPVSRMILWS